VRRSLDLKDLDRMLSTMLAANCKKSSGNPDMNGQLHFLRFISRRRDAAYFILVQTGTANLTLQQIQTYLIVDHMTNHKAHLT
jgi:hypothetical protein